MCTDVLVSDNFCVKYFLRLTHRYDEIKPAVRRVESGPVATPPRREMAGTMNYDRNVDRLSMSDTSPQTTSQHLMYPTAGCNVVVVNSATNVPISTSGDTAMHVGPRNISRVSTTQLNQSGGGAVVTNKIPLSQSGGGGGTAINRGIVCRSTGDELNSNYQFQTYGSAAPTGSTSGPSTTSVTTSGHVNLSARSSGDQSQYATYQNVAFKQQHPVLSAQEQLKADDLAAKQFHAARKGNRQLYALTIIVDCVLCC